jgi:hypothetical protein
MDDDYRCGLAEVLIALPGLLVVGLAVLVERITRRWP